MKITLFGAFALSALFAAFPAMAEAPGRRQGHQLRRRQIFRCEGRSHVPCRRRWRGRLVHLLRYRRYHAECHVCHGPNGGGSTYAPALKESVKRFNYAEFAGIVIGGRQNGNSVMPAFADNKNAVCYIDDLYIFLRGLSTGAIRPGRPEKNRHGALRPGERALLWFAPEPPHHQ